MSSAVVNGMLARLASRTASISRCGRTSISSPPFTHSFHGFFHARVKDSYAHLQRTKISDGQACHIFRFQGAVKCAAVVVLQARNLTAQHFSPHTGRTGYESEIPGGSGNETL